MSDKKCFCIDREKELEERVAELANSLIDAACDLSSCPNMEFKVYMNLGRKALVELGDSE